MISFVGAGPGATDLLTLRALKRIQQAEVLIWTDSLISPEILNFAPSSCEIIGTSTLTLEEILQVLIDKSHQEKNIVRLHDGDPCLYGAISEQISRLADAGIEVDVIPGISAYQATASSLQAELTIPGLTQTIILSRASGRTVVPAKERLDSLAKIGCSLCLYLSARHIEDVHQILMKHYKPETPVAIGYRVSWPDEWVSVVTLKEMAKVIQ